MKHHIEMKFDSMQSYITKLHSPAYQAAPISLSASHLAY